MGIDSIVYTTELSSCGKICVNFHHFDQINLQIIIPFYPKLGEKSIKKGPAGPFIFDDVCSYKSNFYPQFPIGTKDLH